MKSKLHQSTSRAWCDRVGATQLRDHFHWLWTRQQIILIFKLCLLRRWTDWHRLICLS